MWEVYMKEHYGVLRGIEGEEGGYIIIIMLNVPVQKKCAMVTGQVVVYDPWIFPFFALSKSVKLWEIIKNPQNIILACGEFGKLVQLSM